ncbi:MAG: PilZ domain-containing protein [Candidatus Brocadia sp.]|nr:PilZ domain-containing protein [Candidatus Brocadia sp.]
MSGNRYFSRIKFPAQAQIELNNTIHKLELLDISLRGALLHSSIHIPLTKGICCLLKIYLPTSNINLTFNAELVHLNKNNLGFKFLDADIDTVTHLRNLLGHNVGNHDKITHEFHFWLDSV